MRRRRWGRHYTYDEASWDRETMDSLRSQCIKTQDRPCGPPYPKWMTHRERCWELERESFYREFFVNGDPVANCIYFKLRDYLKFWSNLWHSVQHVVTCIRTAIGTTTRSSAFIRTNRRFLG